MKMAAPEKILLIRLSSMGDIILTTPLVRILKNKYPNAEIDFVVKSQFQDVLAANPHIHTLWTLDTRAGKSAMRDLKQKFLSCNYDWVVDIHKNFRSSYLKRGLKAVFFSYKKYRLIRFLLVKFNINLYSEIIPVSQRYIYSVQSVGIENDHKGVEFFLNSDTRNIIHNKLVELGALNQPIVCIAPGAGFWNKRWPLEYFSQVAHELNENHNMNVFVMGDSRDKPLAAEILKNCSKNIFDFTGQFSIMESACAMDHANLVLTNDSGLMHMAAALNKKTLSIFGPTSRELGFFPQHPQAVVLENADLNCRPCTHMGSNKCPKKHFKCMKDIKPKQVIQELLQLFYS